MSNDNFTEEMRQAVETKLAFLRVNAPPNSRWINAYGANDPRPSNYDILHAYLLLQILDKLESIDDTLITLLNPSGRDKP